MSKIIIYRTDMFKSNLTLLLMLCLEFQTSFNNCMIRDQIISKLIKFLKKIYLTSKVLDFNKHIATVVIKLGARIGTVKIVNKKKLRIINTNFNS